MVSRSNSSNLDRELAYESLGEYAVVFWNNANGVPWGNPFPSFPWWIGSVAEAIFLLGAERNSGENKVVGVTYVSGTIASMT